MTLSQDLPRTGDPGAPHDDLPTGPVPDGRALGTRAEQAARGKAARRVVARGAQAEVLLEGRADPVALLVGQAETRVSDLVPLRYGRMVETPFTFYRGGALLMAADLARTPSSGLYVQLCGDAHLSNFGVFATPERSLAFDVNDFDETHPGPFEWDVKRLAASLAVAGRENGLTLKQRRKTVRAAAGAYREAMRLFARRGHLQVWYSHVDADDLVARLNARLTSRQRNNVRAVLEKARRRDNLDALAKLTTTVRGHTRIKSQSPLLVPLEELWEPAAVEAAYADIRALVHSYRRTLETDRRHLLGQFELTQVARKVVGVGSVGTRCWILLFEGANGRDPLFLQAKEAQPSVLAGRASASAYRNQGQRVVAGQRLMQAASDIFLGWQRAVGADGLPRDYYVRQLRDGKAGMVVEAMDPGGLALYGAVCGETLARAHARSGDRVAIASYLGSSSRFEDAMVEFAEGYADVNERDHRALEAAIAAGRVTAERGV